MQSANVCIPAVIFFALFTLSPIKDFCGFPQKSYIALLRQNSALSWYSPEGNRHGSFDSRQNVFPPIGNFSIYFEAVFYDFSIRFESTVYDFSNISGIIVCRSEKRARKSYSFYIDRNLAAHTDGGVCYAYYCFRLVLSLRKNAANCKFP